MGIDCGAIATWGILLPVDKHPRLAEWLNARSDELNMCISELIDADDKTRSRIIEELATLVPIAHIPGDVEISRVDDEPIGRTYPLLREGDIIVGYGTAYRDPRSAPVSPHPDFAIHCRLYSWPWIG